MKAGGEGFELKEQIRSYNNDAREENQKAEEFRGLEGGNRQVAICCYRRPPLNAPSASFSSPSRYTERRLRCASVGAPSQLN